MVSAARKSRSGDRADESTAQSGLRGALGRCIRSALRAAATWVQQLAWPSAGQQPPKLVLPPSAAVNTGVAAAAGQEARSGGCRTALDEGCQACSRFRSRSSTDGSLCAYHAVLEDELRDGMPDDVRPASRSCRLLMKSLKMWLKSIVGANVSDCKAAEILAAVDSFMCFAESFRQAVTDPVRFCEESVSDYRLLYRFLEHEWARCPRREHTRFVIEGLQSFIIFRKFHQPVKGLIVNPYAASEKLLDDCGRCYGRSCLPVGRGVLKTAQADTADIDRALSYHEPKYALIMSVLEKAHDLHSLEAGQDLEFATSFVCCYLSRMQPLRVGHLSRLLLSDVDDVLWQREEQLLSRIEGRRHLRFTSRTSADPRDTSCSSAKSGTLSRARRGRVSKAEATWEHKGPSILTRYRHQVHARLTKANAVLLLSTEGLGLKQHAIRRRISMLIYEALGKEVAVGDDIQMSY